MHRKRRRSQVDYEIRKEILNVTEQMKVYGAESPEYSAMAENLEKLMKARSYGENEKTRRTMVRTSLITAGCSTIQVGSLIFAETFRDKIIRGVARNFIPKIKI